MATNPRPRYEYVGISLDAGEEDSIHRLLVAVNERIRAAHETGRASRLAFFYTTPLAGGIGRSDHQAIIEEER